MFDVIFLKNNTVRVDGRGENRDESFTISSEIFATENGQANLLKTAVFVPETLFAEVLKKTQERFKRVLEAPVLLESDNRDRPHAKDEKALKFALEQILVQLFMKETKKDEA